MLFAWVNMTHATEAIAQEPIRIVVQKGNTLSQIAKHFNTTWQILQKVNGIKNPNLIYPNDVIEIAHAPEPTTYTVRTHKKSIAKKAHAHVIKKITPVQTKASAPFLWKNPGNARCTKCTLASSVHGLGFPDVVANALIAKVKNRDFTMMKIARGMHFDAMYFGKRIRKENVIASWKSGHTELAREYSVIHDGMRYALVYPLVCGNWSKTTSTVPLPIAVVPTENAKISDNRIAGTDPPIAPEPTPNNIPEEVCITCPDLIVLATFKPLKKEELDTNENTD